jgi:hypothetical protein
MSRPTVSDSINLVDGAGRLVVSINGEPYVPLLETRKMPSIAVAITTRDRWTILESNLTAFAEHTPVEVPIFVIDDASKETPDNFSARFELVSLPENRGIAGAKNKCLELLYNTGAEHLFLFDDDAFPLVDEWWRPYVESPEPHLMRIFPDLAGPRKLNDIRLVYGDPHHHAYTGPRGVMLYVERRVLDIVGGMDTIYGKWGWEHGDWSNRIHNAGLTTWRFADVANGGDLIFSLDEHERVDRGTVPPERREMAKRNIEIYRERFHSKEYREFRDPIDVVLTCLYDARDPQRPGGKPLTLEALNSLVVSVGAMHRLVVFENYPNSDKIGIERVYSPIGVGNLYIQRWYDYWRWLREHPEVRYVWCVDGTDVEMLRDPFPEMQPDLLYLGSEPKKVRDPWMEKNYSTRMRRLFAERGDYPLLNAGLVGGDRATVMSFIREMLDIYEENQIETFLKKDEDITIGINDMGILNVAGYHRAPLMVTGPVVHTKFKANERNEASWWKHK